MTRKTIEIATVKAKVNQRLATSSASPELRQGMMLVLEDILSEAKQYRGFRYLTSDEVPVGELPGINAGYYGTSHADYEARFANTDRTRVQYL